MVGDRKKWGRAWGVLGVTLLVLAGVYQFVIAPWHAEQEGRPDIVAPMAHWPWPHATLDSPHAGVTHYLDHSSPDGTVVELFDFDFGQHPALRLELYDQDEDDQTPFDDHVDFWPMGVGQATRHLNALGRGKVVAAWNGLFFQLSGIGPGQHAGHVAPVVLGGRVRYNVGQVRWAFGVKYRAGKPLFRVSYKPSKASLARDFDFAAEGASCLIHDGQPLRMQPFPRRGENPFPPSRCDSPEEAGFVQRVDHIRTSRTSMAWSRDNRHFYLLLVKDPGGEGDSLDAVQQRVRHLGGGWTVADEQRFWRQFGAWTAVNIDGGDVTQLAAIRPDGRYDMVPPRWASPQMRLTLPADFTGAPAGGTLMYFYVRDTSAR